jgi:hypothetical protein
MTTWIQALRNGLWLFIAVPSLLRAESIDHLNARWTGSKWEANRLVMPNLANQRAFFPLVTRGPGRVQLARGEPCILRIALLSTNSGHEEKIAQLWGRIHGKTDVPLAALSQKNGKLIWRCPISSDGDSLFDAPTDVELPTALSANVWQVFDVIINPQAYQQMFGWSSQNLSPIDPAKSTKGIPRVARQLSPAAWQIRQIDIQSLKTVWIGRIEILPIDAAPLAIAPNITAK